MSLDTTPSQAQERYSVVLSSQNYAHSATDALDMFFIQMAIGKVAVEIHNSATNESHDLDALDDECSEGQLSLALDLLRVHAKHLSAHQRLEIMRALGAPPTDL
jgi:hypothetical protein